MAKKKKGQSGSGSKAAKGASRNEKNTAGSPYSPTNIRAFITQVQDEFGKIVWPDRKITLGLTGFVLLLVTVLSLYLGSVDLFLGRLVAAVLQ